MPPCESETQVSSGSRGTRRSPSSTRIRMLPICGPLPCVMTMRAVAAEQRPEMLQRLRGVLKLLGNRAGLSGRVIALPPNAMTSVPSRHRRVRLLPIS